MLRNTLEITVVSLLGLAINTTAGAVFVEGVNFTPVSEDSCDRSQVSTASICNYKLPHERK
jgi:hypothetical protein